METSNCMSVLSCVSTNVATAFFASLERCSCINLSTIDFEDDVNFNAGDDHGSIFLSSAETSLNDPAPAAAAAVAKEVPA